MRTASAAIIGAALACSTFDGFGPNNPRPVDWGDLVVSVGTTGLHVFDKNLYTVVLDSAIQGYAMRHTEGGVDTVWIEPILAGQHHLRLTGVRPYCSVEDGPERVFTMVAGRQLGIGFSVHCVYPDATSAP